MNKKKKTHWFGLALLRTQNKNIVSLFSSVLLYIKLDNIVRVQSFVMVLVIVFLRNINISLVQYVFFVVYFVCLYVCVKVLCEYFKQKRAICLSSSTNTNHGNIL